MMIKEGLSKFVNFMTVGARVLVLHHSQIEKMHYFSKILLHFWAWVRQTKFIVNDDHGRMQNFIPSYTWKSGEKVEGCDILYTLS